MTQALTLLLCAVQNALAATENLKLDKAANDALDLLWQASEKAKKALEETTCEPKQNR